MVDGKVALITGTTSNLGINIAYRLLEESPKDEKITIIVTSRTLPKAKQAIKDIKKYAEQKLSDRTGQLEFDYLLVDFTDMVSILSAYYDIAKKFKKIDYVFINAAQGTYSGIDWLGATKEVLSSPIEAVTNPTYKKQRTGVKTRDGMGLVFQANVFGPYYLLHKIKHLLYDGSIIVWISSIMSQPKYLSFNDLQLIESPASYEGSKRLVDLLHSGTYEKWNKAGVKQYLTHPGIFTSFSFFEFLNVFTYYGMLILFYIARWLGSPWHNISGYTAANAPTKCAFHGEGIDQSKKFGSASTRSGEEYIIESEIDTTGAEDVTAFIEKLTREWDEKLKDQIVNTRQP